MKFFNDKKSELSKLSWRSAFAFHRGDAIDAPLFFILLSLLCFGLVICFSSYFHFSTRYQPDNQFHFITQQLQAALVGIVFAVVIIFIRIEFFFKITPLLWVITVLLNIWPVTGVFGAIRGGSRWIVLNGFSFQPSELAKLTLALYLARVLFRKEELLEKSALSAIKPAIMTFIMVLPIYAQNDFSTAAFIFAISIVIFFLSGVNMRYIIGEVTALALLAIPTIWLTGYRFNRIIAWRNPGSDPQGLGWQPLNARAAIEAGGLFGVGLGEGTFKLGRMSMVSSDYIFTVVGEELGLIGIAAVIALFTALVLRSWQLSLLHNRSYERILMLSLAVIISASAFLNMLVVSGWAPVTGINLPFFSAGGSNMVVTLMMSGFLLNLSRSTKITHNEQRGDKS